MVLPANRRMSCCSTPRFRTTCDTATSMRPQMSQGPSGSAPVLLSPTPCDSLTKPGVLSLPTMLFRKCWRVPGLAGHYGRHREGCQERTAGWFYRPTGPRLRNLACSGHRGLVVREVLRGQYLERCVRLVTVPSLCYRPVCQETLVGERGLKLSGGEKQRPGCFFLQFFGSVLLSCRPARSEKMCYGMFRDVEVQDSELGSTHPVRKRLAIARCLVKDPPIVATWPHVNGSSCRVDKRGISVHSDASFSACSLAELQFVNSVTETSSGSGLWAQQGGCLSSVFGQVSQATVFRGSPI